MDTKMCFPPWLFRDEKHINVTCYNIIFRTPMQALQPAQRYKTGKTVENHFSTRAFPS